jgi:hypothetical protein
MAVCIIGSVGANLLCDVMKTKTRATVLACPQSPPRGLRACMIQLTFERQTGSIATQNHSGSLHHYFSDVDLQQVSGL